MLDDDGDDDDNKTTNSLKLMFPNHPECYLYQVVKHSIDLHDAVDMVLSDDKGKTKNVNSIAVICVTWAKPSKRQRGRGFQDLNGWRCKSKGWWNLMIRGSCKTILPLLSWVVGLYSWNLI